MFLGRGLRVVRARPFNHVGPGQVDDFVVAALARRMVEAELDNGKGRCESATSPLPGTSPTFATSCGPTGCSRSTVTPARPTTSVRDRAVSISALAEQMAAMLSCEVRLVEDPELFRPVEVPVLVGDASKLVAATGWHPAMELATTLSDVLDYWRARLG